MATLKGIIFDFNGTLLWDTQFNNKAWKMLLHRYHIALSDQKIRENIQGRTNAEILQYIFKKKFMPSEVNSIAAEKEEIYKHLIINNSTELQDGATDIFDYCYSCAIPIAIATSSDKANADFFYERYNLKKWIPRQRLIYNDYTFESKPAPDIFYKTAKRLFLNPDEIIVFEDSPLGIKAAEQFGAGKIIIINSTGDDYSEYPYLALTQLRDAIAILDLNIVQQRDQDYIFE